MAYLAFATGYALTALLLLLRMHAFQAAMFLHCYSPPTSLVVYPSGKFQCSRHTSLYRDSLNLVTRGIMAQHIPVRIWMIDCANG